MEKKFIKIGEAAKLLGVSIETMRRWEQTEELRPDRKTKGKQKKPKNNGSTTGGSG